MVRMKPLVVILGATGTGKSKLAIEIACKFNGEIISADSMQVYKGLDIVTNKVTMQERMACPHHMIDFVSPLISNYTVTDFQKTSLHIMEDIWHRNKLPIIVGGTNYYIESLLWNFILQKSDSKVENPQEEQCCGGKHSAAVDTALHSIEVTSANDDFKLPCFDRHISVPTPQLYSTLQDLDSSSAEKIHPNDRRKILRALQVLRQTGWTRSELIRTQHNQTDADIVPVSGALRYSEARMIWIQCEAAVLNERLNKRVNSMIEAGLVSELLDFHHQYNHYQCDTDQSRDYTLGLFQTIGFKEFHKYLMLTNEERSTEFGLQLLQEGIDGMKQATRKYAKRQIKWIHSRFLQRKIVEVPPVYVVDATYESDWEMKVLSPATDVVSALLQQKMSSAIQPVQCEPAPSNHLYRECRDCNVTAISRVNWEAHISGRRHKKRVASRRKAECDLLNTLTAYSVSEFSVTK